MTLTRKRLEHAVAHLACELITAQSQANALKADCEFYKRGDQDTEDKRVALLRENSALRDDISRVRKTALLVATKHGCRKAMQVAIGSMKGTK